MGEDKVATGDTVRVHLILDAEEVKAIDDYGFAQRIRTRSEAMRRLIRKGLEEEQDAGRASDG